MKLVRFEFDCSRKVAWYSHLCNHYLSQTSLNITTALLPIVSDKPHPSTEPQHIWRYLIEAEGEQATLEQLADDIGANFLLSCYLIDSRISIIDKRIGNTTAQPLTEPAMLPFCQHCQPLIGDNQSPQFGAIQHQCEHCHGETQLENTLAIEPLTNANFAELAQNLIAEKTVTLSGAAHNKSQTITLSRSPFEQARILICNPNNLNAHFQATNTEVIALSTIEKPFVPLRPCQEHPQLTESFYSVTFAADRATLVLAEYLRVKGIDWIYFKREHDCTPVLTWVTGHAVPINSCTTQLIDKPCLLPETLHDSAQFGQHIAYDQINAKQHRIILKPFAASETPVWDSTNPAFAAECALNALCAEFGQTKNQGLIYLSDQYQSQIRYTDGNGKHHAFFSLPSLPATGNGLIEQLLDSPQAKVTQKFAETFPENYRQLQNLEINQHAASKTLNTFWAIAAIIIGIGKSCDNINTLNARFIASAMGYNKSTAPRIDFQLTSPDDDDVRSLNWCKTLGALMSLRIAGDDNVQKLAYAVNDSFADYLANWIEHLDLNVGIKRVYLSGSSFINPVLSQRIARRLGINIPLGSTQQLDLDSSILAAGALWLKQRRR